MPAQLGRQAALTVSKRKDHGVYLDAGELGEVLLPRKFVPPGLRAGDSVSVFLYQDSEDRVVATTQSPRAQVGEFAYLPVADVNPVGAFLDWGLDKDLLVPFAEQHRPMEVGRSYLVYVYIDRVHGRITASSKIDKFLKDDRPHGFRTGQTVDLIIANSTDLGYKAIVDHSHWGLLHKADVFQRLSFGQGLKGCIKQVRPDGRLDLSLQSGKQRLDRDSDLILDYLRSHQGYAPLGNQSDPKLIAELFGTSKAAFKRSIGRLLSQGLITVENEGVRLADEDEQPGAAPSPWKRK